MQVTVFLKFNCVLSSVRVLIDSQGSPGNSIRGAPGPPGIAGIKGECQVVNTITKEEVRDNQHIKAHWVGKFETFYRT